MQEFTDWNGIRIGWIARLIRIGIMNETKILKNGVDEVGLHESDLLDCAGGFADCPLNMDPKIVIDESLILQNEQHLRSFRRALFTSLLMAKMQ